MIVEASGAGALDQIEQVILTVETLSGHTIEPASPPLPPVGSDNVVPLRLTIRVPVTLTLQEPSAPIVTKPPVVDVRPGRVPVPHPDVTPDAGPPE